MERNRRIIREQEEQRLFRQSEEERLNNQQQEENFNIGSFRNDNRNTGFREDGRSIPTPIRQQQQQQPQPPLNFAFGRTGARFQDYTDKYIAENINFTGDWESFMELARNTIVNELSKNRNTKIFFSINANMRQIAGGFNTPATKNLRIKEGKIILEGTNLNELYDQIMSEINETMEILQDVEGSGWVFEGIKNIEILTVPIDPLRGSKYIELPEYIANKKAIINIKNKDEDCFKWCILRALNPKKENPNRVDKQLRAAEKSINMEGISSPTKIDDITKFEKQNEDIAVVVLGLNENGKVNTIIFLSLPIKGNIWWFFF